MIHAHIASHTELKLLESKHIRSDFFSSVINARNPYNQRVSVLFPKQQMMKIEISMVYKAVVYKAAILSIYLRKFIKTYVNTVINIILRESKYRLFSIKKHI